MENAKNEHKKENAKMDKNTDKNTNKKNFKEEETMQEVKRISRLGEYRERLYDLVDELEIVLCELEELQEEMEEEELDQDYPEEDEAEAEPEENSPQVTVCFYPNGCEFMIPVELFGGLADEH